MSQGRHAPGFGTRLIQAAALVVVFALLFGASRAAPVLDQKIGAVAAIGFLLLAGTLMSELLEPFGLPHLSGYILAGVLAGPHVLRLLDHATVDALAPVNTLALALIALAGGAALRLSELGRVARSVAWALFVQCSIGLVVGALAFAALARYVPFSRTLGPWPLVGVALLWGAVAASRSPSACLAILSQTRARGPVASFSLAFVMASDVVVVVMMACVIVVARPMLQPGLGISLDDFGLLGHELLGSVATGTTLGILLAVYLKLVGRDLLLVLFALGFGMTELTRYVRIDALLSFLTAGFVVQNLSDQGDKLLGAAEKMGGLVFVVFFATAGAHLDVPLLQKMWPVALGLCAIRAACTYLCAKLSNRLAHDPPPLRRWGWSALISQAGLTLGLGVVVARTFPEIGEGFHSLVIAVVAINELIGPVLFKLALDRSGETDPGGAVPRSTLYPAAPQ